MAVSSWQPATQLRLHTPTRLTTAHSQLRRPLFQPTATATTDSYSDSDPSSNGDAYSHSQTELIVNGGLEGSISPWILSGAGAFYTNNGNYPHGGTGYMYFGVNNNVSGQVYQTVTIPSTATGNLTFWFNCSSSEGVTRPMISCTSRSATPAALYFKPSRPTATRIKPQLETTRKNRLALLLTEVRLSDCNSVARLIFRSQRPSG